jgi:hypothetical protein
MRVDRRTVLGYRFRAQQLDRSAGSPARARVLDIGVQDGGGSQAALAFAARLAAPPSGVLFGPDRPLALAWSLRGAPYVHRRRDLDRVAAALYPLSEADAAGRLNETGPSTARAGIPALEQYALAVAAMREVVQDAVAKGAASTEATKRLPEPMRRQCRACKTRHISDSAMRAGSLTAGIELVPDTAPPVLQPRPSAKIPARTDTAALRKLVLSYLTLLGPATQADVADYFGVRRADLAEWWPDDDLVEVEVGGRRAQLPAGAVGELTAAEPPDAVRLLGAFDPFLQARDRDLLVPDRSVHKALWPVLGRPGVLLVAGDVAGVWRPKSSGRTLTLQVETFAPLPEHVWADVDEEAQRVAAARGADRVAVQRRG